MDEISQSSSELGANSRDNFDQEGFQRDKFHEECGLMGIWSQKEAANLCYLGLFAQQHRGQEGAGIVSLDRQSKIFGINRGLGLVNEVFNKFDFTALSGEAAIGHVRYSTSGSNVLANVQPFLAELSCGRVAIAHNGNLINANSLRQDLVKSGAIISSTSDTELILHLMARDGKRATATSRTEMLLATLPQLRGAFSLLFLFDDRLIAVRDPHGFRPLVLGALDDSVVVASETCALDLIGARFIREVQPGEVVEITKSLDTKSYYPFAIARESACIFEYVYFARPDSEVFGRNVYRVRRRLGQELAREHPTPGADVIIPVPDSGVTAALGYADESKLPFEMGLIRNHYIGRTFIEPLESIRDFGVRLKLNANKEVLKDRSVVVVDDSIVRGTTSRKIVAMLRDAGAREVHLRVSSPPTTDPCYYGIDTPEKDELIASRLSKDEIARFLGVNSLEYLSVAGLYRAVTELDGTERKGFCDACFTGHYAIGTPKNFSKKQVEMPLE